MRIDCALLPKHHIRTTPRIVGKRGVPLDADPREGNRAANDHVVMDLVSPTYGWMKPANARCVFEIHCE